MLSLSLQLIFLLKKILWNIVQNTVEHSYYIAVKVM